MRAGFRTWAQAHPAAAGVVVSLTRLSLTLAGPGVAWPWLGLSSARGSSHPSAAAGRGRWFLTPPPLPFNNNSALLHRPCTSARWAGSGLSWARSHLYQQPECAGPFVGHPAHRPARRSLACVWPVSPSTTTTGSGPVRMVGGYGGSRRSSAHPKLQPPKRCSQ